MEDDYLLDKQVEAALEEARVFEEAKIDERRKRFLRQCVVARITSVGRGMTISKSELHNYNRIFDQIEGL